MPKLAQARIMASFHNINSKSVKQTDSCYEAKNNIQIALATLNTVHSCFRKFRFIVMKRSAWVCLCRERERETPNSLFDNPRTRDVCHSTLTLDMCAEDRELRERQGRGWGREEPYLPSLMIFAGSLFKTLARGTINSLSKSLRAVQ